MTRLVGNFVCNGPAAPSCSGGTQIYGTADIWHGTQMQYLSDTVLNQQITYGYGDGFNRLTARTVTAGTAENYTYAYDQYRNRVSQTPLSGGYSFQPTISISNNHITTSGYTYDAAGNMTSDGVHSYTYDGEGNITQVDGGSTAKYVYDVFNHRIHVQTASGTMEYVYDYAGRRISSWLSPSNSGREGRIYWDGQQIAYRSIDGTTYLDHQDTLGTERMRTNFAGSVGATFKSLPWADGYSATINSSGADQDNNHFAGLERDAESGTEHADFRNYASAQGRWLAPDPNLGSYDLLNPQTMNRYSYALNNPASLVDPSGLDWCLGSVLGIGCDGPSFIGTASTGSYDPSIYTFSVTVATSSTYDPDELSNPVPGRIPDYGGIGHYGGTSDTARNDNDVAIVLPPTDPCQQKAQDIQDLRDEILGRFQDYSNNANPLPLFGTRSRAGHIHQIGNKQTSLQNALNDYRTSGCGGPSGNAGLPGDVNQVALAPLPGLSPSRPTTRQLLVGGAVM
jgi:RHS repeat-associated protein